MLPKAITKWKRKTPHFRSPYHISYIHSPPRRGARFGRCMRAGSLTIIRASIAIYSTVGIKNCWTLGGCFIESNIDIRTYIKKNELIQEAKNIQWIQPIGKWWSILRHQYTDSNPFYLEIVRNKLNHSYEILLKSWFASCELLVYMYEKMSQLLTLAIPYRKWMEYTL